MKPTNKQVIEATKIINSIKNDLNQVKILEEKWKITFFQAKEIIKITQNYSSLIYNLILNNGQ